MSILNKVVSATKPVKSGSLAICTDCNSVQKIVHVESLKNNRVLVAVCSDCIGKW